MWIFFFFFFLKEKKMNQSVENLAPPTLGSEVEKGFDFEMYVEIGRSGREGSWGNFFLHSDIFSLAFYCVLNRAIYKTK